MNAPKKLTAVIRNGIAGYMAAHCADAPKHLRLIYLERWAVRSAKVGDRVEIEYRKTASGNQWVVTQVLS